MKYRVNHKTWYAYADPAPVCHNLVHLAPRATPRQACDDYQLTIDPVPAFLTSRDDAFGNRTEYFSVEGAHRELEIVAESVVEVRPLGAQLTAGSPAWEECRIKRPNPQANGSASTAIEPLHRQLTFP